MIEKLAFETRPYKGLSFRAFYLEGHQDARVETLRNGAVIDTLLYPAYKIWNIAAHAEEIIDSELEGNARGWFVAGADGFGGYVLPRQAHKGKETT